MKWFVLRDLPGWGTAGEKENLINIFIFTNEEIEKIRPQNEVVRFAERTNCERGGTRTWNIRVLDLIKK